jgi:hypothetical protein
MSPRRKALSALFVVAHVCRQNARVAVRSVCRMGEVTRERVASTREWQAVDLQASQTTATQTTERERERAKERET